MKKTPSKEEQREYRSRYREKNRAHINELAAKYRREAREREEEARRHAGEALRGHNLSAMSDMTVTWKPRRVKVVAGWRGQKVAGGGSMRRGFEVQTDVNWKL